jgi:hypothetical protein
MAHTLAGHRYQDETITDNNTAEEQSKDVSQDMDTDDKVNSSAPYPELISGIPVYCEVVDGAKKMYATLKVRFRSAGDELNPTPSHGRAIFPKV